LLRKTLDNVTVVLVSFQSMKHRFQSELTLDTESYIDSSCGEEAKHQSLNKTTQKKKGTGSAVKKHRRQLSGSLQKSAKEFGSPEKPMSKFSSHFVSTRKHP
jgi:hypothetical protein